MVLSSGGLYLNLPSPDGTSGYIVLVLDIGEVELIVSPDTKHLSKWLLFI